MVFGLASDDFLGSDQDLPGNILSFPVLNFKFLRQQTGFTELIGEKQIQRIQSGFESPGRI